MFEWGLLTGARLLVLVELESFVAVTGEGAWRADTDLLTVVFSLGAQVNGCHKTHTPTFYCIQPPEVSFRKTTNNSNFPHFIWKHLYKHQVGATRYLNFGGFRTTPGSGCTFRLWCGQSTKKMKLRATSHLPGRLMASPYRHNLLIADCIVLLCSSVTVHGWIRSGSDTTHLSFFLKSCTTRLCRIWYDWGKKRSLKRP